MYNFDLGEHAHRRFNPLTGEWIQVSPHRAKRPWQGQVEKVPEALTSSFDPTCYLCPGNKRSNGEHNPDYKGAYAFVNDFSAIPPDVPPGMINDSDLIVARNEKGICKVICFSPEHNVTLPEMETDHIAGVVKLWIEEYNQLGADASINYVQVFENKGAVMGCSNPHPHGQIWAQESIPMEPYKKQQHQLAYFRKHGRTLLQDYLKLEIEKQQRIVLESEHFKVVVPFWATWPFETMIIPVRPMQNISQMTAGEIASFAEVLKRLTCRYDNLFEISFPYSAGIHQAPTDGQPHDEWHWHMVFYPPLLRSATVRKFMVGYEMLANPQRDITPEYSAGRLRGLSEVHYKAKANATL